MFNWMQVIDVVLPGEVQEASGCQKPMDLGPTTIKDKTAEGKQLYAVTVGGPSGRVLAVARNVKDRSGWD